MLFLKHSKKRKVRYQFMIDLYMVREDAVIANTPSTFYYKVLTNFFHKLIKTVKINKVVI